MKKLSIGFGWTLFIGLALTFGCKSDDGGGSQQTAQQAQTSKLTAGSGTWVPGTVVQETDGDVTTERFSDFSITFNADAEGNNKTYSITNTGGEAFEAGSNKAWEYVGTGTTEIERLDNQFTFTIALTESDSKLRINVNIDPSGSPLGRTLNTTGGYEFNLVKQ